MTIDLLVHGGDVLTVDEAGTVVRDGRLPFTRARSSP